MGESGRPVKQRPLSPQVGREWFPRRPLQPSVQGSIPWRSTTTIIQHDREAVS